MTCDLARPRKPKLKLNPFNREDKMCRSKRAYSSIEEMKIVAFFQEAHGSAPLYGYKCPYDDHYHLTKHPTPVSSTPEDRVNIRLVP